MKKIISGFVIVVALGVVSPSFAQSKADKAGQEVKKGVNKGAKSVKKTAKKVGDETAEHASTAKAKVTDKKSSEWVGPDGQDIYVNDGTKFYWIDNKGKRIFITRDQLKTKP